MENYLKILLGIAAITLAFGLLGTGASAHRNFGGMIGAGFGIGGMHNGMMRGMMNGDFDMRNMHEIMHGNNSGADMNLMHRAMHGEDADFDMNGMHERMLAGNLTSDDLNEMKEHCPMMK